MNREARATCQDEPWVATREETLGTGGGEVRRDLHLPGSET